MFFKLFMRWPWPFSLPVFLYRTFFYFCIMINRRKPGFQYLVTLSICLMAFMLACNSRKSGSQISGKFLQVKEKASLLMATDPLLAIKLMDSVVKAVSKEALADTQMFAYIQLKADALIILDRKDSAYSVMQSFHSEIEPGKSNYIKIHSGLWLSQHLTDDGKYIPARKYLDKTLTLLEKETFTYEKANALNIDGTLLSYTGDYLSAQKRLLEAIRIFESLGDTKALGPVYINLASNYQSISDSKQALLYYRKACSITSTYNDSINYLVALKNLGIFYCVSRPDSAEFYFSKARNLIPLKPWAVEALSARFHLAGLYYEQKKYRQALDLYNEVLAISQKYNIKSGIYRAMSGIGNVYEAQNHDNEALKLFQEAALMASAAGETPIQINLLEAEEYMYEKAENYKEAYLYQKKIRSLRDSLFALDKQIAVHDLELAYNNEKTERKNESLSANMLLMKNRIRTNSIIIIIVLISALVLGMLLFNIYRLYRQRDSAYNTLFEKYRNDIQPVVSVPEILPADQLTPPLISDEASQIYQKLTEYFESAKPYLNCNLRFDDVSIQLRVSRKILSALILEHNRMNFNTFINSYRVKEALKLLASPEFSNYKIEAIAKEAGFGSKASFYAAFSQITGTRPSEYR